MMIIIFDFGVYMQLLVIIKYGVIIVIALFRYKLIPFLSAYICFAYFAACSFRLLETEDGDCHNYNGGKVLSYPEDLVIHILWILTPDKEYDWSYKGYRQITYSETSAIFMDK